MKQINTRGRCCLVPIVMSLSVISFPSPVLADWSDWWSTPEQRALKLYESGNVDALLHHSPNENWTALGQFQDDEFSAASASFANSRQALIAAEQSSLATVALYNQGVSDVLSEQYEKAIQHFDAVLTEDPGFTDAQINRDIAEELLELQKTSEESQNQDGEDGQDEPQNSEPSESGESSEDSDNQSSDSANEEASESEESAESGSASDQNGSSSTEAGMDDDVPESATEKQEQLDAQQAREALAAEALEDQSENGDESARMRQEAAEPTQPLSESEQATEQILRRIPDDPRGLLRRKLEQSHRNEFPEVRDANEPW